MMSTPHGPAFSARLAGRQAKSVFLGLLPLFFLLTGYVPLSTAETLYHVMPHKGIEGIEAFDSEDTSRHMKRVDKQLVANGMTFRINYVSGSGFTDSERTARLEDALTYVASVLNESSTVDVQVNPPINIAGSGILAVGGTSFDPNVGRFVNGIAFDQITEGSQFFPGLPEITIQVDFSNSIYSGSGQPGSSEFDLYSVLVHEITHALGFISLSDANGNSSLIFGEPVPPPTYSFLDSLLTIGPSGGALFGGSGPSLLGSVSDLTNQNITFSGSEATSLLGRRPPIDAPPEFFALTSLSHWNSGRLGDNSPVMSERFEGGETHRVYTSLDLAALSDLGYTNIFGGGGEGEGEGEGPCDAACADTLADTDGDGLTDCDECELGLNADSTDTDGDGLPDGFEVDSGLNPTVPDAKDDPDEDGQTNIQEFLAGSDPMDATSPSLIFFVAKSGSDTTGFGSLSRPWASIGFAIGQTPTATASNPVRINVFDGTYTEDIALRPWLTVAAALDNVVIIEGTVTGANDSSLIGVILLAASARKQSAPVLLDMSNVAMHVEAVTFQGTSSGVATGILADGAAVSGGLIERSLFTGLGTAIDIGGGIPVIRTSELEDLSGDGIVVRATADTAAGTTLGQETDAASGFNTIDITTIDGFAVNNERSEGLVMQNNYWGTGNQTAIEDSISGEEDVFIPFLATANSVITSALYVNVINADTQAAVTNGAVDLLGTAFNFDPVTENTEGIYVYPAISAGTYTVQVTASGFVQATSSVTIPITGGQQIVETIPMQVGTGGGGEGEGEGEGEGGGNGGGGGGKSGSGCYGDPGASGQSSALSELLLLGALVLLLVGSRGYIERARQ